MPRGRACQELWRVWVWTPSARGRLLAPVLAAQRAIVYARARRALGWEGVAGGSVRNGQGVSAEGCRLPRMGLIPNLVS